MKKILKYLLVFITVVIVIIVLAGYLYKNSMINNLNDKKNILNKSWSELYENTNIRMDLITSLKKETLLRTKYKITT